MRRRELMGAGASALFLAWNAFAQQTGRVWRIGFLHPRGEADLDRGAVFRRAMRERGYIEGKDYVIDLRAAEGRYDRLPGLAEELVRSNVDVIVARGSPAIRAAQRATRSI